MSSKMLARALALLAMLTLGQTAARAADDAAAAKAHFTKGTAHFNVGEFAEAAEEYKAAYKISQNPIILYNVGQAYRNAGDFHKAIFFYKSYLRNLPNAENKKEVQERLHALEMQVAKTREAATAAPNSPMGVDLGKGSSTTTEEPQERPQVASTAPTPRPNLTVPATHAETSTSGSSNELVAGPAPKKTPIYKKAWFWGVVGGGVAVIALGVGLGVGLSGGSVPATDLGSHPVF